MKIFVILCLSFLTSCTNERIVISYLYDIESASKVSLNDFKLLFENHEDPELLNTEIFKEKCIVKKSLVDTSSLAICLADKKLFVSSSYIKKSFEAKEKIFWKEHGKIGGSEKGNEHHRLNELFLEEMRAKGISLSFKGIEDDSLLDFSKKLKSKGE